jgi:hypothetical protein
MAENLSPFLDTAFTDPGAARLAASMKRKQAGMVRRSSSSVYNTEF